MTPRRQLALVVLACAAGAALALVASGRPWEVAVIDRPAPLPSRQTERSGGELWPWLPALAWVALAGAGALLATRAAARRVVGGLLVLAGAGLVLAGAVAAGGAGEGGAGAGGGASAGWPLLAALGGLLVAATGGAAVVRGRRWPAMGARYERPAPRQPHHPERQPHHPEPGKEPGKLPDRPEAVWDALDRGEDPTAR